MRKIKDGFLNAITYLFSSFGILILGTIVYFIFHNGFKSLNFNLLVSDYYGITYNTTIEKNDDIVFVDPKLEDVYFSSKWGIGIKDDFDRENKQVVKIVYIDKDSPFNNAIRKDNQQYLQIQEGSEIEKIFLSNSSDKLLIALSKDKALTIVNTLEAGDVITDMITSTSGGGIRGSLVATLYLILLTLIIALPIGVISAIYLNEYAKKNRFMGIIRHMIEMMSGIPSIIFGLVGAIIFIPLMDDLIGSNGGSIASGALTLAIMLLPIIIRTTEESLKIVPRSYKEASYALGASKNQTIFKVVLPNAISGIMTATLLSIARIIGESAALIYAMGTVVKDSIHINEKATSLSVHIWILMGGEVPNFELASAISILILLIVFLLGIVVKIIAKKFNRFEVK